MSCINLKVKPFLDHLDVIETISGEYGYNIRTVPGGRFSVPLSISDIEDCQYELENIEHEIRHHKSMCVVKYDGAYDFMKDMFVDSLTHKAKADAIKHCPCILVNLRHESVMYTLVMRNCNTLKWLFTDTKLKHARRCEICLEKNRKFKSCFRCGNRCCDTCLKKLPSLTCPFCKYDILEHHVKMGDLYDGSL